MPCPRRSSCGSCTKRCSIAGLATTSSRRCPTASAFASRRGIAACAGIRTSTGRSTIGPSRGRRSSTLVRTLAHTRCSSLNGLDPLDAYWRSSLRRRRWSGLQRHLPLNALDDRVEVVPAAVCDSNGHRDISLHPHGGASGLYTAGRRVPWHVETTSLDAVLRRSQAHARGPQDRRRGRRARGSSRRAKSLASPNVTAFVEFHPSIWAERGFTATDVGRELQAMGLVAQPLDPGFDVWTMEGVCARLVRR